LRGLDRDGRRTRVDLDGDGRVSLLEAHARVRIASHSISVPTTTSERWLRHAASRIEKEGGEPPEDLVEEQHVIATLSEELGVAGLEAGLAKLADLRDEVKRREGELRDLQIGLEVASADLRIALLERWPVLDDAYHPDYASTLDANEAVIRRVLDGSVVSKAYQTARAVVNRENHALDELDVEIAMVRRLVRAYENVAAAAKLRDYDPVGFARWQAFLKCERAQLPIDDRHASPR
jgi:hypothetical protein